MATVSLSPLIIAGHYKSIMPIRLLFSFLIFISYVNAVNNSRFGGQDQFRTEQLNMAPRDNPFQDMIMRETAFIFYDNLSKSQDKNYDKKGNTISKDDCNLPLNFRLCNAFVLDKELNHSTNGKSSNYYISCKWSLWEEITLIMVTLAQLVSLLLQTGQD